MIDRSEEIQRAFVAQLPPEDPASVRVVQKDDDGNEQYYKVYIHRPQRDHFVEYDVFLSFDDPCEVPPYAQWAPDA